MSYSTFDQFQGIWLGSIIGQALANKNLSEPSKIINYQPSWLAARDQIAETLLETERLEVSYLADQLAEIFKSTNNIDSQDGDWANSWEFSLIKDFNQSFLDNGIAENRSLEYSSKILAMLPLIIFYGSDQNLFTEVINQCNLKLANSQENTDYIEDILSWGYLLTLAINNRLSSDTNVSLIVRQILTGARVKQTSLTAKLNIVAEAWEQGISLYQLRELLPKDHIRSTVIALSVYCFATTPQDFRLSIKRAASLEPQLAWLTTALTGTVSGAYNGIAGIPRNWRAMANHNLTYQSANQTIVKLFQAWLGIYSVDSKQFLYNPEVHAVAPPKIIQPRSALRIISQKLF
ncbi:hypothetical protein IQ255_03765 [Pleurocapsales cyanobacterium LEGE 10410]|nr:hypothetical protein [Pleurocapsales cyanobacterium LEGE 10410]